MLSLNMLNRTTHDIGTHKLPSSQANRSFGEPDCANLVWTDLVANEVDARNLTDDDEAEQEEECQGAENYAGDILSL